MELNKQQIEKSINYVEDVLENWTMWQTHHNNLTQAMRDILSLVKELTEENERLREICKPPIARNIDILKANTKIDTVRKMQERLKAEKFTHKNFGELVYVEDIDQIAKEMLEGVQ